MKLRHLAALTLLCLPACDLPPKDLGKETIGDTNPSAGNDTNAVCQDGDSMPAPDDCNTCSCDNGQWSCTELGCSDTDGPSVCQEGDSRPAPDGCNTCFCADGQWACTEIGCVDTDTPAVCQDGDSMPAPDGCNTCFCAQGQWAGCTKIECEPAWFGDEVQVCDPGAPRDGLFIDQVTLDGDTLVADINYSGGCEMHLFGLCWDDGIFLESSPVQVPLFISHDDRDDLCDALPSQELRFDLVPLRDAYREAYQTDSGSIFINLDGWDEGILYSF